MLHSFNKIVVSAFLVFSLAILTVFVPLTAFAVSFNSDSYDIYDDAGKEEGNTDKTFSNKVSGGELPSQPGLDENGADYDIANYRTVAESDGAVLYADMDNGYFALKNKNSGKLWYSVPNDMLVDRKTLGIQRSEIYSQIILQYVFTESQYETTGTQAADSYTYCVQEDGGISVEKIDNGIKVTYNYSSLDVVVPVEYSLDGDSLKATVVKDNITVGDKCILMGINILPSFGAGNWDDEGWLFVPDGSGVIVNFNNGVNALNKYNKYVYGDELAISSERSYGCSQTIRIPVFATNVGTDTLTGIITNGEGGASISFYNGNSKCGYNCISSTANFLTFAQRLNIIKNKNSSKISSADYSLDTYEVHYYMSSGNKAKITGVAEIYRNYLKDQKKIQQTPAEPSFNLNLYGFVETDASFLGIPYSKKTALTTASQAQKIVDALKEQGINAISVRYIGWSNSGVDNKKIQSTAGVAAKIGSKSVFKALEESVATTGGSFYPDVDLLRFTKSGNGVIKSKGAIKNPFQALSTINSYLPSNFEVNSKASAFYLLTPQKIDTVSQNYLKSYQNLNLNSISLTTVGQLCYSNFARKYGFNRVGITEVYEQLLKNYSDAGMNIAVADANAYTFNFADKIFEAPIFSSGFDSFDYDVPFYQMVLHGIVTMTSPAIMQSSNPETTYLKSVEYGLELMYSGTYHNSEKLVGTAFDSLYSTNYDLWISDAAKAHKDYYQLYNSIYDRSIISNTTVAENVKETVYDNGIEVYVNYNEHDVTVNGISVGAGSFTYREAE